MPGIEILDTGLVYRNPAPHLRSLHAFFPSLVSLPGGGSLCGMDIGSAIAALDRRSYVCRSDDGGKSWSAPAQIFEPDQSVHAVSTSCRLSRLPNGEIVGLACLFDRSRPDAGHSNPETDGFVKTELALVRSTDEGHTWSQPTVIEPPIDWRHFEICSPVVGLADERLLIPTSIWPDWDGHCSVGAYRAIVFVSDDNGRTWPRVADVMDLSDQRITGWEQKQTSLSDGRLMTICWCMDFHEKKSLHNRYTFSTDNGDTFGPPIESPLHGETNTPLALADNHVLCLYRRVDRAGLWAHLARIDGDAWTPLADAPIWGDDANAYASDAGGVMKRMNTLQFGCPTMIQLESGDILSGFWCHEGGLSAIRWYRMLVTL